MLETWLGIGSVRFLGHEYWGDGDFFMVPSKEVWRHPAPQVQMQPRNKHHDIFRAEHGL